MFLSLDGFGITNHAYVDISSIESTDLSCHTNSTNSEVEWFSPDGVNIEDGSTVSGFSTSAEDFMVVRLVRATGTPQEGIYFCSVEDTEANISYVGVYNHDKGVAGVLY